MSLTLIESNEKDTNDGLPWGECIICGQLTHTAQMQFKNGSVAPQVGETLTGGTSGDTAVVSQVFLKSGTWAGGTAAGVIQMVSPTGYDQMELALFTDGEAVTGSLGAAFVPDGNGWVSVTGKQYSRNQCVVYDGKIYCQPHFRYMWNKRLISDAHIDINEDVRFLSWT